MVSVIIPVYNCEEYLPECLDSLIAQSYTDLEIICVNDGSTDHSLDILNEYQKRDNRFKVLSQKNINAGAARNNGFAIAAGEYCLFLDSDDFFEPDMIRTAVKTADERKADIVVFRSDCYYNDIRKYAPVQKTIRRELLPNKDVFSADEIQKDIFNAFMGWAWDKLFRTRFIKENNIYFQEQRTSNDLFFVYASILKADRITTIDDVLLHQRQNAYPSLSVTREKSWKCCYDALLLLRNQMLQWGLYENRKLDFENYSASFLTWHVKSLKGESQQRLFYKLKQEYFNELGVSSLKSKEFYNKQTAWFVHQILQGDYEKLFGEKGRYTRITKLKNLFKKIIPIH